MTSPIRKLLSLDLPSLRQAYLSGAVTPAEVMDMIDQHIETWNDPAVWIHRLTPDERAPYLQALAGRSPDELPLYGVPFAIKDNIDLAGIDTTAGCPAYAYRPQASAFVVERLVQAGAIPVGKTNLDQFATGLVGTRSPYGIPRNALQPERVPGGSSSGSAVAVAAGLVSFALGTDTAGSGRVPAAFNNIVGLKPTRGLLSTRGVVPACQTLDCVSIFSLTCADAQQVFRIAAAHDPASAWSRPLPWPARVGQTPCRVGIPRRDQLEFFGDKDAARAFETSLARLREGGVALEEIDIGHFLECARLLYEGPWVAERYAALRDFIAQRSEALHPVTRTIIEGGTHTSAVDAFAAQYRLAELKRLTAAVWERIDVLVTPTAGTHPTLVEVEAEPIRCNSRLGHYTNFMNLLDLCCVALPAGLDGDRRPYGMSLVGPAGADEALLGLAGAWHRAWDLPLGALQPTSGTTTVPEPALRPGRIRLAVCGAHLSGMPLNHQLTDRRARLDRATRTAPCYRLYALPRTTPPKPGLVRSEAGRAIEIEIWELTEEAFGSFVSQVPRPLCIGKVETEQDGLVSGFLCEPEALQGARDITELASWRRYTSP